MMNSRFFTLEERGFFYCLEEVGFISCLGDCLRISKIKFVYTRVCVISR